MENSVADADQAHPLAPLRVLGKEAGAAEIATTADRRKKAATLRDEVSDSFPRRFPGRMQMSAIHAVHGDGGAEAQQDRSYRVAGRLMACRRHRKATFMDLRDESAEVEVLCLLEDLDAEAYEQLSYVDVGDIVGVDGRLVATRRGEPALRATAVAVLGKSFVLPPQKNEPKATAKSNRLEADLIAGAKAHDVLRMRSKLIADARSWFAARAFLEVETPILLPLASGAAARPFVTHGNALDSNLYLRIATEQHLKRWVIGGFDRIFEVARCFRNEGMSNRHHFEFTMLEWIEGYADYEASMRIIEEVVSHCAVALNGSTRIERKGELIDLAPPWRRVSIREAIGEVIGMDIQDADRGRLAMLLGKGVDIEVPWPELVGIVYSKLVEPKLSQPAFVMDFPGELFPLARRKASDPWTAESFEAVIGGIEIATGVTCINDVDEQRVRFAEQRARSESTREREDDGAMDEEFLGALAYGMMPATCAGVGVDRVLMLLAGGHALREVIPFPTLRGEIRT